MLDIFIFGFLSIYVDNEKSDLFPSDFFIAIDKSLRKLFILFIGSTQPQSI
jgi:hypothetical protein